MQQVRTLNPVDPDVIVEHPDGRPVLVAQVEPVAAKQAAVLDFAGRVSSASTPIPFGVFVDPETIYLFRSGIENPSAALTFRTVEVLRHYSPEFEGAITPSFSRRFFQHYLTTLTGAWLSDLALPWKSGRPPKVKELTDAGVLSELEGCFTRVGMRVYADLVS